MFSRSELDGMRATQESVMMHRVVFRPWNPTTDALSGQQVSTGQPVGSLMCGVDFTPKGSPVEGTEGVVVAHYRIRLPRSFAAQATPLSRYQVVEAYGELLPTPLTLEQVSDAAIGPSGVVVWARNVT